MQGIGRVGRRVMLREIQWESLIIPMIIGSTSSGGENAGRCRALFGRVSEYKITGLLYVLAMRHNPPGRGYQRC
jgi:hypothetical protein